jgi:hypothetical protein
MSTSAGMQSAKLPASRCSSYQRGTACLNVRYWPKADIASCTAHVRFWGKADIPTALQMSDDRKRPSNFQNLPASNRKRSIGLSRFPFQRRHIEDTRKSGGLGQIFPAEVEQGTFSSRTSDSSDDEQPSVVTELVRLTSGTSLFTSGSATINHWYSPVSESYALFLYAARGKRNLIQINAVIDVLLASIVAGVFFLLNSVFTRDTDQ